MFAQPSASFRHRDLDRLSSALDVQFAAQADVGYVLQLGKRDDRITATGDALNELEALLGMTFVLPHCLEPPEVGPTITCEDTEIV